MNQDISANEKNFPHQSTMKQKKTINISNWIDYYKICIWSFFFLTRITYKNWEEDPPQKIRKTAMGVDQSQEKFWRKVKTISEMKNKLQDDQKRIGSNENFKKRHWRKVMEQQ